jgi:hypothetical protein
MLMWAETGGQRPDQGRSPRAEESAAARRRHASHRAAKPAPNLFQKQEPTNELCLVRRDWQKALDRGASLPLQSRSSDGMGLAKGNPQWAGTSGDSILTADPFERANPSCSIHV